MIFDKFLIHSPINFSELYTGNIIEIFVDTVFINFIQPILHKIKT